MRKALLALPISFLLAGCFTVPTEKVVDTIEKAKSLSGSVKQYQQRFEDTVEFGQMKLDQTVKTLSGAKAKVDDIVEGTQKIKEGVDQIRGENAEQE